MSSVRPPGAPLVLFLQPFLSSCSHVVATFELRPKMRTMSLQQDKADGAKGPIFLVRRCMRIDAHLGEKDFKRHVESSYPAHLSPSAPASDRDSTAAIPDVSRGEGPPGSISSSVRSVPLGSGSSPEDTAASCPIAKQEPYKSGRRWEQRSESWKNETSVEDEILLLQPELRSVDGHNLRSEVLGIYKELLMVEARCIDEDNRLAQERDPTEKKLTPEKWRSLVALHKKLLHEHHDFFLTSQHPSASPVLAKLAEEHAMLSRMWRHAIHGFLEVLRHRLPDSLEFMRSFIGIAYNLIAYLHETIPRFECTWIECLGDIGR